MASPEVLGLTALLEPLEGDSPAGASLKYDGLYDEIREARRADDPAAQGEWARSLKDSDWPQVISLAVDALTSRTRDMQVAAWLGEALVKVHGFAGLRDSLKLLSGLHESYWDTMFPEVEDGDLEGRANAMAFFDRQCALALKEAPVTKAPGQTFSFLKWEESRGFDVTDSMSEEAAADVRQRAEAEGKITGDVFRKAKNATRTAFYEEASATLAECWDEFKRLDALMDEKFGRETPGLGDLKKALDAVREVVDKALKEKRALEPSPAAAAAGGEAAEGAEGQEAASGGTWVAAGAAFPASGGPIRGREDALRRLDEVAAYFTATEPHSPVAHLVRRAAGWGRMGLEAWLAEVVKDGGVLAGIRETLGLKDGGGAEPTESE